jgi:hypothetical protein
MKSHNSTITSEMITLTPELSASFLSRLPPLASSASDALQQRSQKPGRVQELAKMMTLGQWKENGQGLLFDKDGNLIDGQHRCLGCILSGVSIRILVTTGVDSDAVDTIDTGSTRTAVDVLSMTGMSVSLARIASTAVKMEMNMRTHDNPIVKGRTNAISPASVRQFVETNPVFLNSCQTAGEWFSRSCPVPASYAAYLLYRARLTHPKIADDFVKTLVTGENLNSDDSRLWIRNRLFREMVAIKKTGSAGRFSWSVKAWNRFKNGKGCGSELNFFRTDIPYEMRRL